MERLRFSRYFRDCDFPVSVTVMPASGVKDTRLHSHDFSELVLVGEGSITHHCGSASMVLRKGDFFIIHPGASHAYRKPSPDALVYNLLYDSMVPIPVLMINRLPFLQELYPAGRSGVPSGAGTISRVPQKSLPRIVRALECIRTEVKRRKPGHDIVITALFMEIAVLLARAFRGGVRDTPDWALTRVVGFLRSHCADKILVGDLARFAGMSESTLLRRFKSAFGIGPMAYLMDLRVRNAVALLKNGELKLGAVAAECGFCDGSHLWKALNRRMHLTPSAIRGEKTIAPIQRV